MIALPKAITFDCYGTLIDWEKGIQQFFAESMSMKGYGNVSPQTLQEDWEEIQFRYIQEKYRPYRQVLADTLRIAFEQYSIPTNQEEVDEFVDSMGYWKPFPDTKEAIIELQKLVKVVLITNTDDTIIAQTEQTIGVKFDEIITAEQAKAYKPSHEGFLLARERLGLKIKEIWHAGFGFKYDIVPAKKLGYTTVWVNRQRHARPTRVKETFMVGDIQTLAYFVKGVASDL